MSGVGRGRAADESGAKSAFILSECQSQGTQSRDTPRSPPIASCSTCASVFTGIGHEGRFLDFHEPGPRRGGGRVLLMCLSTLRGTCSPLYSPVASADATGSTSWGLSCTLRSMRNGGASRTAPVSRNSFSPAYASKGLALMIFSPASRARRGSLVIMAQGKTRY